MSDLALRRGTVVSVDRPGLAAELTVEVGGERRRALSFEEAEPGDDVIVNVAALDLALGSGGFDIVHANLTRGLDGRGEADAHVMKLNYPSLQHAVHPVEEQAPEGIDVGGRPVAVIALHGQLPCVAWAAAQTRPGARVGYVQTAGGALPGAMSRVVQDMLARGLLAGHVTAAPAYGGRHEAISTAGGLHAGLTALHWDAAIVGPGPGILGSATTLGHGGLVALDNAHAALALGAPTVVVPRMSSGDPRPRHRGMSHHTETVLRMLLRPALVAIPEGDPAPALPGAHEARVGAADLDGYLASGLPARTMGRGPGDDELFFRAALAGGSVLGAEISK
ncbi:MAG: hypothetical protein QOC77_729 [Thermoleophilaceae bacterium]|nr:hypothetical protein [Thermoleophilaceae bacterium]